MLERPDRRSASKTATSEPDLLERNRPVRRLDEVAACMIQGMAVSKDRRFIDLGYETLSHPSSPPSHLNTAVRFLSISSPCMSAASKAKMTTSNDFSIENSTPYLLEWGQELLHQSLSRAIVAQLFIWLGNIKLGRSAVETTRQINHRWGRILLERGPCNGGSRRCALEISTSKIHPEAVDQQQSGRRFDSLRGSLY